MASFGVDPNANRNPNNPYDFNGVQVSYNYSYEDYLHSKNHLQVPIRETKLVQGLK
jgi:hypothetical protein